MEKLEDKLINMNFDIKQKLDQIKSIKAVDLYNEERYSKLKVPDDYKLFPEEKVEFKENNEVLNDLKNKIEN